MRLQRKKDRLSAIEIMISIALVTAPFTSFRIGFFGISEVMLAGIIVYSIIAYRLKAHIVANGLAKHFLWFIASCIIGWIYNLVFRINSGTTYSAFFNLASYLISALIILAIEEISNKQEIQLRADKVLKVFFIGLSLVDLVLFIISRTRRTLFGRSLFYYTSFAPLADNIHQFAMIAMLLPFIGFYNASIERNIIKKLYFYSLSFFDIYITIGIDATKATLGTVLGLTVLVILLLNYNNMLPKIYLYAGAVIALTIIIVASLFNIDKITNYGIVFFNENDNHGARSVLYSTGLHLYFSKGFLFGLGPASHVTFGNSYYDAHDTFLTAALSGGIIGLISVTRLFITALKQTIKKAYYFSALIPIIIYAIGGDLLRKAALWVIITLLVYGPQKTRKE